jgi:hypothetical protein
MKKFELTVKRVTKVSDYKYRMARYRYSAQTSRDPAEDYKAEYSARLKHNSWHPQRQKPSKYRREELVWCSETLHPFSAYLRSKGAKLINK